MKIGLIGLGRMGGSMVRRLIPDGHEIVTWDLSQENVEAAVQVGAVGASSLEELVAGLDAPRTVWVMLPHGEPTRSTIRALFEQLGQGDTVIDGGNSPYTESIARAAEAEERGLHFLDVGVSGGLWGLESGYCLMVGGPEAAFTRVEPVLASLAPDEGYGRVGPTGAGHFVKMIHNAIEYAMLQALGEGFECLRAADWTLDLRQVAALWGHGSVIRSWLLTLLERALEARGNELAEVGAWVDDSGTGRWTVDFALQKAVPVPAIAQALFERFDSRTHERFAHKTIAALREQFGGHAVKEEGR